MRIRKPRTNANPVCLKLSDSKFSKITKNRIESPIKVPEKKLAVNRSQDNLANAFPSEVHEVDNLKLGSPICSPGSPPGNPSSEKMLEDFEEPSMTHSSVELVLSDFLDANTSFETAFSSTPSSPLTSEFDILPSSPTLIHSPSSFRSFEIGNSKLDNPEPQANSYLSQSENYMNPYSYQDYEGNYHWMPPAYWQAHYYNSLYQSFSVSPAAMHSTKSSSAVPSLSRTPSSSSENLANDGSTDVNAQWSLRSMFPSSMSTNSRDVSMSPSESTVEDQPAKKNAPFNISMPSKWEELPRKIPRRKTTNGQLIVLNAIFEKWKTPSTGMRDVLAEELEMTSRAVQVWFQNKRQTMKKGNQNLGENTSDENTLAGKLIRSKKTPSNSIEEKSAIKMVRALAKTHYQKTGDVPEVRSGDRKRPATLNIRKSDPKNPVWVFETPFFQARI